jgi:hypothetical protein
LGESPLKQRIRDLGERLDSHRKRQQEQHPGLTLTGIYNVLEKLRSGEALNANQNAASRSRGYWSRTKGCHPGKDSENRGLRGFYGFSISCDDSTTHLSGRFVFFVTLKKSALSTVSISEFRVIGERRHVEIPFMALFAPFTRESGKQYFRITDGTPAV